MPAKKRPPKRFRSLCRRLGVPDARFAWRGGDARAAPRMLRQPMRNLDDRFRLVIFGPPIGSQQYVNRSTPSGVVRVKVGVWLIVGSPS
jgi:hypothetical protein